jgi:hypothetical protein
VSGEHRAVLEPYFGEEQYEALQSLARKAQARGVRGGERVLILPGVMGSKLGIPGKLWDDVIWIDPLDVVPGNLALLKLDGGARIEPLGVFLFAYLKLKFGLRAQGFDADFHPYDWRRGIAGLGAELKARIEGEGADRVHLVGHSMGGLVARAAIKQGVPKLGRLVMLGTPNFGSFRPAELVRGVYPILQKLAAADLFHSAEELADEVFNHFPSVYELLVTPNKVAGVDLHDPAAWPKSGPQPDKPLLAKARRLQHALAEPDERFHLIAGVNRETIAGIRKEEDEFVYELSPEGDGTVPLELCLLPGVRTYYVEEDHGALPNHDAVGLAVAELLRHSAAVSLSEQRPQLRHAPRTVSDSELRRAAPPRLKRGERLSPREARALLAEVAAPGVPAAAAAAAAVGAYEAPLDQVVVGRRRQHRIDLKLARGSIAEVNADAVVLGVFRDVTPQGAARAMDERLGGAITELAQRRMFAANVGEVFILPATRAQLRCDFVAFAGLGPFGEFGDQVLQTVAENAIRTLIRAQVDDFATVLIGGGSGEEVEAALVNLVQGFVRGLLDADRDHVFRRITLCEMDPARFEAMKRQLYRLTGTRLFEDVEVTITEEVLPEPPRLRAPAAPAAARPMPIYLTVTAHRDGAERTRRYVFRSSLLGVGAKATVLAGERRVTEAELRGFQSEIEDANLNFASVSRYGTRLGELVLAEEIKDALAAMPEGHPLVLVHDATASRLPWETLCVRGQLVAKERGMHRRYLADHLSVAKWLEERRRDNILNLLLVVNPTEDLDGAEQEGDRVLELFKGNAGVKILVRRRAEARRATLLADIRSGAHDVIHYAGHAFFDPVDPSRSGILCAGKEVLSGADLAGINNLPSLVFFNACEAGRIRKAHPFRRSDGKRERLEERLRDTVSFAEAFLRGGVANYVGTYWPVGDASAKTFGSELYARLLEGKTVGEALQSARAKVFDLREVDWADYIHYGDQAFVLKEAS